MKGCEYKKFMKLYEVDQLKQVDKHDYAYKANQHDYYNLIK